MKPDSTRAPETTRRQFGRAIAGATVAAWAAPAVVRGRNLNEKLNIACIGVGGRGGSNLRDVALGEHRRPLRRLPSRGRTPAAATIPRPAV